MTETRKPVIPSADPPAQSCLRKKRACLIVIFILALIFAASIFFCPWLLKMRSSASPDSSQTDQRLAALEQKIQILDARLDDLSARFGKETEAVSAAQGEEGSASVQTLTHLQGDLTALSSVVVSLQAEVKQAGNSAAATQQAAQSSVAAAIAFVQLRAAAEAGRGFASELAALNRVAPDDGRFREAIENLKPYADKGAPTLVALREEFTALEASASVAIDQSVAKNWWQRICAELKGLVSIRPLHGGDATGALATVENALAIGNLDEAVAAVKTLPQDTQAVLKDWLAKAQMRATIDMALHELSDGFAALASPASTSNLRNEP